MKKLFTLFIIFLMVGRCFSQDERPTSETLKPIQSPQWYYDPVTKKIAMYKGSTHKWNQFFSAKEVQFKIDSLKSNVSSGNAINAFSNTLPVTSILNSVTWPTEFSNPNYYLSIRAWYNQTISGKSVQIQNAVYDFNKTVSGFSFKVDTVAGYYEYFAADTANLYPLQFSNYLAQADSTLKYVTPYQLATAPGGVSDYNDLLNKPTIPTTTAQIAPSTDRKYLTDAEKVVIGNTSGTNTGDETLSTIKTKLGITTLSGSNTGDETLSTIKTKLGITTLSGSNTGDETDSTIKTKLGITTLSGSNTGDETTATIKTKLGITTLSGSNTGDQDLSGLTPNTRSISTTAPLQGGGNLYADRTLSITQASGAANGYLSSTDWTTFNSKQAALVSGTNIKTVNSQSLLGSGNIVIEGGSSPGVNVTVNGLMGMIYSDETASTEINTSTTETTLKTYNIAANDYTSLKIEVVAKMRIDQDTSTNSTFTWRFKVGASTVQTFVPKIISMNTAGVDGGGNYIETLSIITPGGQTGTTAITITAQNSLNNAATGSQVLGFRVYGIKDVTYTKGDKGDPGTNGTNGTNGAAATIAVGTTTTGNAGTNASVTNSGTSSAATFNFTIPRGADGASGTINSGTATAYNGLLKGNGTNVVTAVAGTDYDASATNEGSLTVGAGTATTSIINSNTSGSTGVTLTAAGSNTISESGNVITITATETDPVVKSVNGIVKSNGSTISAAVAGTDYPTVATVTGKMDKSANLSDVAARQTALNNLTNAAAATATHVLTRDVSGNVGFAAPPGAAFSGAKIYSSTNSSSMYNPYIETGKLFNSEEFDTDNYHSTVTNTDRITIPATGYYRIEYHFYGGVNGVNTDIGMNVRLQGTSMFYHHQYVYSNGSSVSGTIASSFIKYLTANDVLVFMVGATAENDWTVYGGAAFNFVIITKL